MDALHKVQAGFWDLFLRGGGRSGLREQNDLVIIHSGGGDGSGRTTIGFAPPILQENVSVETYFICKTLAVFPQYNKYINVTANCYNNIENPGYLNYTRLNSHDGRNLGPDRTYTHPHRYKKNRT